MAQAIIRDENGKPFGKINPLTVKQVTQQAVVVAPSDTVDLVDGPTAGLYVGGAGNIAAIMADGNEVTFTALSIGVVHPISVKRVKLTGTTATLILAMY